MSKNTKEHENNGTEQESADTAEKESPKPSSGWIAAAILAIIVMAGLTYGYTVVTENNRLVKLCNEYSGSPDLKYPTTCVPFKADSSGGDYVDTKSTPLCKCTVDLGNGTSTVIDVRVSK